MGGVNLFDGKLSKQDTKKLMALLTNINKDIMWYICNMKMDMFGMQVLHKVPSYITKHEHEIKVLQMILLRTQDAKNSLVIDINTQATALNVQATLAWLTTFSNTFEPYRHMDLNYNVKWPTSLFHMYAEHWPTSLLHSVSSQGSRLHRMY